jgi:hypothetical protein
LEPWAASHYISNLRDGHQSNFFKKKNDKSFAVLLEEERNKVQKMPNKKGGLKLPTPPTTRASGRKQM